MKQLLCVVILLLAPTLCCAESPANPDVQASIALAKGEYDEALELYQTGGADPNAQYEDGMTALMHTMKTVDPVLTEKSIEILV